jgi:phage terminase small subunit
MKANDELSARETAFVEALLGRGADGKPMAASQAYQAAGYRAKGNAAEVAASRMLRKAKVAAKIKQRRREIAEASQIEKWQLVDWLSRALLTPIGEIDADSDLAQEVTEESVGEEILRTKTKVVGKIEAGKLLATLLNWTEPEKHEVKFEIVIGGHADA